MAIVTAMVIAELFQDPRHLALVSAVIKADQERDPARFAALFTEDGTFCIGSNPALTGPGAIASGVATFFAGLAGGIAHRFLGAWSDEDRLVWQAEVIWTLRDGRVVCAPYVNVLRLRGDSIVDYHVHVDLGVLAPSSRGVVVSTDSVAVPVIVVIDVDPERQEELLGQITRFVETTVLQQPGFLSSSLHASVDGRRIINYALWRSQADYERFARDALLHSGPALFAQFPPDGRCFRLAYQAIAPTR